MRVNRRPKLGQHFLSSPRYRERIAAALPLRRDELVVEIGPGRGAMTGLLRERAARVVAIELDGKLAAQLKKDFAASPAVQILHGDILAANLEEICRGVSAGRCYVFGSLPYYITSPIIHRLFEFRACVRGMTLLMQREVGERIVAEPGSRDYGYLSVMVQLFAQPRILFSVPPGAFSPPPKVQSALVDFRMTAKFPDWSAEKALRFLEFAKTCFAQKRKSLANNLMVTTSRRRAEETVLSLGLPANVRAEQITLDDFAALYAALAEKE